jgi:biopolymer transport protein ExbD
MLDDELPEQISIDVTPMATIALILVIIFISSSTTWMQPLMKVELPTASTAESERKQNLTISIAADDALAIDDVSVEWPHLYDGLQIGLENNADKFVIIRADKKVTYGRIIHVMGLAKKAGARSITIATEQKRKETQKRV